MTSAVIKPADQCRSSSHGHRGRGVDRHELPGPQAGDDDQRQQDRRLVDGALDGHRLPAHGRVRAGASACCGEAAERLRLQDGVRGSQHGRKSTPGRERRQPVPCLTARRAVVRNRARERSSHGPLTTASFTPAAPAADEPHPARAARATIPVCGALQGEGVPAPAGDGHRRELEEGGRGLARSRCWSTSGRPGAARAARWRRCSRRWRASARAS